MADGNETPRSGPSVDFSHGDLQVSADGRFLIHADGTPFFYLGDTAWELFHRLNAEEAERYLEKRRQQGFTVIQAVALAELDGLNTPNDLGHRPLVDNDPARPDGEYWRHVDAIVEIAAGKGIYIGMLPTWGDKLVGEKGRGPQVLNADNARVYGKFIAERYRDCPNMIWINGGDRLAEGPLRDIWVALAESIRAADTRHLMTYHPRGGRSSSQWFHEADWLDFNMLQSGHGRRDRDNYTMVRADYERAPVKPVLDGEPCYEDHPINWKAENGWFDACDVRQAAYWGLFAGACGHTYGCHPIWQMIDPAKGHQPASPTRHAWHEVLELAGAWDMGRARALIESRPFLARVPDQSLLAAPEGKGADHVRATRGEDYLFAYLPAGKRVTLRMGGISGAQVRAWWYDPRTGGAEPIGKFDNTGTREFTPPGEPGRGNDWVLVIDDAGKEFPAPGSK